MKIHSFLLTFWIPLAIVSAESLRGSAGVEDVFDDTDAYDLDLYNQDPFERDLQATCINPEKKETRTCKRKWYAPWKKTCKTTTKKCYLVHKYKYSCYGLLGVEKFSYPKDCNFEKIGSFRKYSACFGLKFKGSGCFDYAGIETNTCPDRFSVSGSLIREICD